MHAHLMQKEQRIRVAFRYNTGTIADIKNINGRKWHPLEKVWSVPLNLVNVKELRGLHFKISKRLGEWYARHMALPALKLTPLLDEKLWAFQKDGVAFIEARRGRALIGDEMGLGKTVQALAWLSLHPEARPAVMVVPATVKLKWAREIYKWLGDEPVYILNSKSPHKNMHSLYTGPCPFLIINYDILPAWLDEIKAANPKAVIIDECHYIKNRKTQRTGAVLKLCRHVPHTIALSGTPIINRPYEFFNAINLIDQNIFPNHWQYVGRYCGWDKKGAHNTIELNKKLTSTIMLRRLKKDIINELPPKVRDMIPLPITNMREYREARDGLIQWLRGQGREEDARKASGAEVLVKIEVLKQLAVKGKLDQCIEWIKDFILSGEKLIVFAVHKFVIDILNDKFMGQCVVVDGRTSQKLRNINVDRFQNDKNCPLFIGNIKAAGVGIDLTAASNTAFLELPWTPGELVQAEDRAYGRLDDPHGLVVHYLLAEGTIEEYIADMLDEKTKVLSEILDGKKADDTTLLTALMARLKGGLL